MLLGRQMSSSLLRDRGGMKDGDLGCPQVWVLREVNLEKEVLNGLTNMTDVVLEKWGSQ